jgi:hypothetical protein
MCGLMIYRLLISIISWKGHMNSKEHQHSKCVINYLFTFYFFSTNNIMSFKHFDMTYQATLSPNLDYLCLFQHFFSYSFTFKIIKISTTNYWTPTMYVIKIKSSQLFYAISYVIISPNIHEIADSSSTSL